MAYKFSDSPATLKRAELFAVKLMQEADDLIKTGSADVRWEYKKAFPIMFGWWRLINRSTAAFWDLTGRGYTIEAAPLMRNIVDHTLAMVWLADVGDDGLPALELSAHYSQDKLAKLAKELGWSIPPGADQVSPPVPDTDPDYKKYTALSGEFANFSNRVNAFAMRDMYVVYQYLSRYSHASLHTAAKYAQLQDNGP
ncbi:hypothetical protein IMZ11_16590 [Microtetraspora sp. AC03309]|uniref:DUF5677 domain-containing protein n=1 Tax=Microtetraspora sp. AC03309 TaxID=2779376 RepID=UPI001E613C43|nr:DUF5677 domain-containing protein [Microtetraspora sp. AC03309]MCC5577245.1 hypothetical protein [Microtetraspora sp. AC03309]